eukprot:6031594-Amphidinium_carterae.2
MKIHRLMAYFGAIRSLSDFLVHRAAPHLRRIPPGPRARSFVRKGQVQPLNQYLLNNFQDATSFLRTELVTQVSTSEFEPERVRISDTQSFRVSDSGESVVTSCQAARPVAKHAMAKAAPKPAQKFKPGSQFGNRATLSAVDLMAEQIEASIYWSVQMDDGQSQARNSQPAAQDGGQSGDVDMKKSNGVSALETFDSGDVDTSEKSNAVSALKTFDSGDVDTSEKSNAVSAQEACQSSDVDMVEKSNAVTAEEAGQSGDVAMVAKSNAVTAEEAVKSGDVDMDMVEKSNGVAAEEAVKSGDVDMVEKSNAVAAEAAGLHQH